MARITVEDCITVVNNQYDLVILAKERAVQLGRGAAPAVDEDNDKKPVIALREIAELTDNYTPPADACNTYKVTFAMLEEFEKDLHLHIHLENNILFPEAVKLEAQFN